MSPAPSTPKAWRTVTAIAAGIALSACTTLPMVQTAEDKRRAELAEQERQVARSSALCRPEPGTPFVLRKKVLVLAMPVTHSSQAADLPGIASAWPRELQRRLAKTDRFLLRDGTTYTLDPLRSVAEQITTLARQFDAQVVVSGEFTSLGTRRGEISLGRFKPIAMPSGDERVLETTLTIHDGYSGAAIAHLQHNTAVKGKVDNRGHSTLSSDFFTTTLGQRIDELLRQQTEAVEDALACLPMQARIIGTSEGRVHLDAGFTSNLQAGMRLRLFVNESNSRGPGGQPLSQERPLGELLVEQVYPEQALARFDSGLTLELRSSAHVRAW
ncbi:flagella assembly protein FlgT middle domain-containing protein [Pseudothauera lacus]|uniref:Flagellar assembly protein T middle domain-containing protein n=1 Tax=Pseudothauera lacus TaxID=2136175 RepID=A0A2T4IHV1_9RHOO|nr:flagella assembly protein FlgT middle domain-containing protein [Pseudothauera lacus]PTD97362.1 hypothetical protein C8261_04985 [Pseudothauera lacus]